MGINLWICFTADCLSQQISQVSLEPHSGCIWELFWAFLRLKMPPRAFRTQLLVFVKSRNHVLKIMGGLLSCGKPTCSFSKAQIAIWSFNTSCFLPPQGSDVTRARFRAQVEEKCGFDYLQFSVSMGVCVWLGIDSCGYEGPNHILLCMKRQTQPWN